MKNIKSATTVLVLFLLLKISVTVGQNILAIIPANGNGGQKVTIKGLGFEPSPIVVFSDNVTATVVSHGTKSGVDSVVVTVPAGAASGAVSVNGSTAGNSFFTINDQQFALAASFVSSIGSSNAQVYAQPNIVASSTWKFNNSAITFRVTGLFTNQDTTRYTNAVNLFKPEVSNLSLKLSYLKRFGSSDFGLLLETNIYSQTLQSITNSNKALSGSITSFLSKAGIQFNPADGIIFYANWQLLENMSGVANYNARFGKAVTSFSNFEFSGMYRVQDGPLKNLYFQPSVIFADNAIHDLVGNKDATIVLIRVGYTMGF